MQNKETKKTVSEHKQKGYLFYALATFVLLVGIVIGGIVFYNYVTKVTYIPAKIGDETFNLELAKTEADRFQGLSERDGIAPNSGMLFDFGANGEWRMVMRKMRFPIDMVWVAQDKKIVHIEHNATPAEYPEVYKSETPAYYVVELPSGTMKRLNVQVGDSISF
jgi:uncharacterized membrane protein (UPF0127 family)